MPHPGTPNTSQAPAPAEARPHPVTVVVSVKIKALAVPEPDGGYSVVVPALPGCFTEADDIDDARENLVEVVELWLDCEHDQRRDEALRQGEP